MSAPRAVRALELGALVLVLALLGHFLASAYVLHVDSDPVRWYSFGRSFVEHFASARLAYAFPLLVSAAIATVGPFTAYLVNVPVLLCVAAAVYAFARLHVAGEDGPGRPELRAVAGFAALGFLVLWNTGSSSMWLRLSNPYRDPLSYLFLVGSGWLLLRVAAGRGGRAACLASGAALALACSARETSALFALPLGAVALFARRRRAERLSLPALALGFALAIAPLLLQNQLTSGSPLLPGQAAANLAASERLLPGWGVESFRETFPRVLQRFERHYGWAGLGLAALGVVAGLRARSAAVCLLSAPAFAIYALFYGAYRTVVPRYLSVLDLFAAPLAGAGVAFAVELALRVVGRPEHRLRGARAALALAALLAVAAALGAPSGHWVTLYETGRDVDRLRLADVRALRREVEAVVPPGALLVAGRPLESLLRCFFDHPVQPLALYRGSRNLRDPARAGRIAETIASREGAAFALYGGADGETDVFAYFLQGEFDLQPAARLLSERHRLAAFYPGRDVIHVDRIAPWSARTSRTRLALAPGREQILAVDVGRLSRYPRRSARLALAGRALAPTLPLDGLNYFWLPAGPGGERELSLVSDGPVAALLPARLLPAGDPVLIDFHDQRGLLGHQPRLSEAFFEDTHLKAPVMYERGVVRVPTLAPEGAAFVLHAVVSVMGEPDELAGHRLALRLGAQVLREGPLGTPSRRDERFGTYVVSGVAWQGLAAGDTPLELELEAPPGLGRPPRLVLRALEVYRHPLVDPFTLALGRDDEPFLLAGFGEPLALPPLLARGAGPEAELRLLAAHPERAAELRVAYLVPSDGQSRWPRWQLNGEPLEPSERSLRARELEAGGPGTAPDRVLVARERFDLAPGRLGVSNVLTLRAAPVAESGGDDETALLLERVELESR